jgi:hypothetical protein
MSRSTLVHTGHFIFLTPSWLLAVVTLQRQHQVTTSWLTHYLAVGYNPITSNTEICLITIISLGEPNLDGTTDIYNFLEMEKLKG